MTPLAHLRGVLPTVSPAALSTATLLALAGLSTAANAQLFSEPALQALYSAERLPELEATALKRLATRVDDGQAVLALAMAGLVSNDAAKREAAILQAQACVQQAPQVAECHYALGTVLGIHAMSQGLTKMASSVGAVKTALLEALRLKPAWYPARSAVVEFYLAAPGLLGGSHRKAVDTARAATKPEQVQALQARVALEDERFDAALAELYAVPTGAGSDPALTEDVQQWVQSAGFALLAKDQPAKALTVFERLQRERPGHAVGWYGAGRVQQTLGAMPDAVRLYEHGAKLKGAAAFGFDYRLGLALQAAGQPEAARTALTRFVAAGKGPTKALDDARKRLQQLGAGGAPS